MKDFRVRPIRSYTGRVQSFAVEQRGRGTWKELCCHRDQYAAMTCAEKAAEDWADLTSADMGWLTNAFDC